MNTARMTAEILALEGWTQARLADEIGVRQPTVGRWLKGQDPEGPSRDRLRSLHTKLIGGRRPELTYTEDDPAAPAPDALDPDRPDTIGEHTGNNLPSGASPQLDVTGGMGAGGYVLTADGVPGKGGMTFSAEYISGYWQLPEQVLSSLAMRARDTLIIPVQGNSMSPTLLEGDYVFVDTRHRFPSPDGIYALADDFGGIIVKTLRLADSDKGDGPWIEIVSDNPTFPPKLRKAEELRIIGRVVRRFSSVF